MKGYPLNEAIREVSKDTPLLSFMGLLCAELWEAFRMFIEKILEDKEYIRRLKSELNLIEIEENIKKSNELIDKFKKEIIELIDEFEKEFEIEPDNHNEEFRKKLIVISSSIEEFRKEIKSVRQETSDLFQQMDRDLEKSYWHKIIEFLNKLIN